MEKVRDLCCTQQLEFGEAHRVLVRADHSCVAELEGVVPDLLAGLAEEPSRCEPVQRGEQPVNQRASTGSNQLVTFGGHPRGEHVVDPLVIASTTVDQHGIGEVAVTDDGKQGLR